MSIFEKLFPWQKKLVESLKEKPAYGLFLDMGLGKTPISLAFAEVNQCEKVIVVTLNGKVYETINTNGSWFWWADKSNMNWKQFRKKEDCDKYQIDENELLVTNYESLFARNKSTTRSCQLNSFVLSFIQHCKGKRVALIIDESHKVKTANSSQSMAVDMMRRLLTKHAASLKLYLLSGTPFTTGYINLYNQLKMLGCNMTKGYFKDEFCVIGNVYGLALWQQPIVGYKNIDELFAIVHKYAVTIKSSEIIDLPSQIFINHILPESSEFKYFTRSKLRGFDINAELAYRKEIQIPEYEVSSKKNNPFYRNIAYPDLKWFAETSGQFWLRSRQLSIGFQGNAEEALWFDKSRLKAFEKFISENPDNYVIFYNFTPELLELYEICERHGYNIDVYSGTVKSMQHYEAYCENLNKGIVKETKNVIIANFASGSTGMNWQNYSHCIIFSLPTYKDYAQALKRVHRIGQKETVFYHLFIQDNVLDNSMMKSLNETTEYTEEMFNADLLRIQRLSEEE